MQAENGPIFEIQEASFAYDDKVKALDQISLAIQAGERIAILGSNGSGKSTLLKIMDGLYFPASGDVRAFVDRDGSIVSCYNGRVIGCGIDRKVDRECVCS